MNTSPYGLPIILALDGSASTTERLALSGAASTYDEAWLQDQVFRYPQSLPIDQIDQAYCPLVPICMELSTPAGFVDALYATPQGKLVLLEAKLWRNPESRRKVIAQILDYARALNSWSYEDLQREVSRATGRKGNVLFDLVRAEYPEAQEASFVDEVSRSLRLGKFLLLIAGDGIREGAGAITEFLGRAGALQFSFGLVEIAVYEAREPASFRLLQPRVIAKATVVERSVIELADERMVISEGPQADSPEVADDDVSEDLLAIRERCIAFWSEFLDQLSLDDPSQAIPNPGKSANIYFYPTPSRHCWISAWAGLYGSNKAGVYLTFQRNSEDAEAFELLQASRDEIDRELDVEVEWTEKNGKFSVATRRQFGDFENAQVRQEVFAYLSDLTNRFVNAFRPRLQALIAPK